ncbi:Single-stranded DNA binding protein [Methanolobus chelungpuianus]|uniref:Replication protein A n=1 Tax=Methanolobus chelungpuianus TaxID=502115 RepID=A0AAE3H922_9EURY|nr:Single-stranded DNA binding protein [Methanolobus chelungpuianus]MCQ6961990.1 replication protein A [Methanolobus chelungpuianus]
MDERIAPHVEELSRVLGNRYTEEIRAELEKLLQYRVPLDEAKRTILNRFTSRSPASVQVKDLVGGMNGFDIIGRVISIEKKNVTVQEDKRSVFTGSFGDGTGICSFTCWDDMSLKAGDAIRIKNAYTRMWNNRPELYFGKRSVIEKLPDDQLQDIAEMSHAKPKKLQDIAPADVMASSEVVIVEMYHRDISLKGKMLTITEGVIADETAKLPFTSWTPLRGADIGSFIHFEGASIRIFRGLPSINFSDNTTISLIAQPEKLPFTLHSVSSAADPVPILNVLDKSGIFDVTVAGNIISVRPGSGIIERCPVCNRVTQKASCRAHGPVECVSDMRIKFILDDGTGSLHVMLNCELSEAVYGKTMYEAEKMARESISKEVVFDDMKRVLTGKYIAIRGNSSKNEFGVTLVAKSAWCPDADLKGRMDILLKRIEGQVSNNG